MVDSEAFQSATDVAQVRMSFPFLYSSYTIYLSLLLTSAALWLVKKWLYTKLAETNEDDDQLAWSMNKRYSRSITSSSHTGSRCILCRNMTLIFRVLSAQLLYHIRLNGTVISQQFHVAHIASALTSCIPCPLSLMSSPTAP
jgi:hypothetical protein